MEMLLGDKHAAAGAGKAILEETAHNRELPSKLVSGRQLRNAPRTGTGPAPDLRCPHIR